MDYICWFEFFIDPTRFGLRLLQGSKLRSVLQSIILRVKGNFIKEMKGDVKNQPYEDTEKFWAPDGIRTHDPLCSRSDATDINISGIGWLVRGSLMGETLLAINVTVWYS